MPRFKVIFEVEAKDLAAVFDLIYNAHETPEVKIIRTTIAKEDC